MNDVGKLAGRINWAVAINTQGQIVGGCETRSGGMNASVAAGSRMKTPGSCDLRRPNETLHKAEDRS